MKGNDITTSYWSNGELHWTGCIVDDRLEGVFTKYDAHGRLSTIRYYVHGIEEGEAINTEFKIQYEG